MLKRFAVSATVATTAISMALGYDKAQCSTTSLPEDRKPKRVRVVVVGGGAAGLGVATELYRRGGFDITLLEAKDRLGGRVWTSQITHNLTEEEQGKPTSSSRWVDLGAYWVHGLVSDNPLYAAARRVNSLLYPTSSDDEPGEDVRLFDQEKGEWIPDGEYQQALGTYFTALKALEQEKRDISLGAGIWLAREQVLSQSGKQQELQDPRQNRIYHWFLERVGIANALDPMQLSLRVWTDQADDGEDGEALVDNGMQRLLLQTAINPNLKHSHDSDENAAASSASDLSSLALLSTPCKGACPRAMWRSPTSSLRVFLNTPVAAVDLSPNGAVVRGEDGSMRECDHVVMTAPLGVLQSGNIAFSPPLPSNKIDALARLETGLLNIVVLEFPKAFWPPKYNFFGYLPSPPAPATYFQSSTSSPDQHLSAAQISNESNKGESEERISETAAASFTTFLSLQNARADKAPLLMAQIVGAPASELETMTERQVAEAACVNIRAMFGPGVPEPVGCVRSQWCTDRFAMGSYGASALATDGTEYDVLAIPLCSCGRQVGQRISTTGSPAGTSGHVCFPRLLFAGEHTNPEYTGTVRGAFLSGVREAARLQALSNSKD